MRAMLAQKTVKMNCTASIAAWGVTTAQVSDVGPSNGTQSVSESIASLGKGTVAVRYVDRVVYFKANAVALEAEFGVKNSKYANMWISIKPGQKAYADIASDTYMASIPGQLSPGGKLTKATVTYTGKHAIEITGSATATMGDGTGKVHLYVSTQSPYLPLGESFATVFQGANSVGSCSLSNWKLSVTSTAPASSIPITKTNL